MQKQHWSLGLILIGALSASPARAQVMADRMPADAIAYASWAGSDAVSGAYDASHFKGFLEALNLPQWITSQVRSAIKEEMDARLALLGALHKSPAAIYIGPVDLSNINRPVPRVAIVSKLGNAQAVATAALLSAAIAKDKRPEAPPYGAKAVGDYLLFFVGDADLENRLAGAPPENSLATSDEFKLSMAQLGMPPGAGKSAAVVYANVDATLKLVGDLAGVASNAQVRRLWPLFSEAAGLGSLKQFAWAGNFDGPNWAGQSFLGLKEHRVGVLAFVDNPPLRDEIFKLIPKSATWAGVTRFDGPRLLADARDIAGQVVDRGDAQFDTVLQQVFAWTGVDVKKDLFPSLGDEIVYYSSSDATGNSLRGITVVNKLKDEEKAANSLSAAENLINLMAAQRDPTSKVQFKTEPLAAPLDKITAHILPLEGATPAWAISGGVLYMSMSVAGLQNAIQVGSGKQAAGSILDNPQFAALRKKLAHDGISSFTYLDLPHTLPEFYEQATQLQALALAANPNQPDRYTLPPLDKIMPQLGPALSICWSDQEGFHTRDSGPFPLALSLNPAEALALKFAALGISQRSQPPAPAGNALP